MRKMDEMELNIRLQAIKWTHLYVTVFLLAWMLYNWLATGKCGLELLLLCTSNLLLCTLQQVFTARATGDRKPLLWLAASAAIFVAAAVLLPLLLIGRA